MAKLEEIKVIDGKTYKIQQYGAIYGCTMYAKLQKSFGKSIGVAADTLMKGAKGIDSKEGINGLLDLDISFVPLMESLLEKIEPEQLAQVAQEILKGVQIEENGHFRDVIFDIDFIGSYLHLIKLLKEVLFFQYKDIKTFFLSFLAGLGVKGAAAANTSEEINQESQVTRIKAK